MKQNNNVVVKILVLVFCSLLAAGCMTRTTTGGTKPKIDKAKALEERIQLAENYIRSGNREAARHHLRRAFELDRNSVEATAAMARLYEMEGEAVLAEEYYRRALRRDKNMTTTRNDYGSFLFKAMRYEEALEQFELAAKDLDYDRRAEILVNVGRTATKLGNTERAESAYKHANTLNRKLPDALIELADLSFQKRDYAAAKAYLDRYAALSAPTPRSLLLGIRIERLLGTKDKEASHVLALRNLFPYSREYLEYKQYFE